MCLPIYIFIGVKLHSIDYRTDIFYVTESYVAVEAA